MSLSNIKTLIKHFKFLLYFLYELQCLRLGELPGLIYPNGCLCWHLHVELGTWGTKPLNNVDETLSMVFLFVCFLIINCHYKSDLPWIGLNLWLHSFHWTATILKLTDKHTRVRLYRVRTEIPALSLTFLSSITTHNGKLVEQKRIACQHKVTFLLWKRDRKVM